jgi:hypothetical protein
MASEPPRPIVALRTDANPLIVVAAAAGLGYLGFI